MSEERKKILEMLADGKIDTSEAEKLLEAVDKQTDEQIEKSDDDNGDSPKKLRYFRVIVTPKHSGKEKVNIKIPLGLIRAGLKLSSMMPASAKDKLNGKLEEKGIGFNIDELNSKSIEPILQALAETSIDVDDEDEMVQIKCE